MKVPKLDETMKAFLRTQVGGVDALDILLLLFENAGTMFTAELVFQQVQTSLPAVAERLSTLAQKGLLLTDSRTNPRQFRANTGDPDCAALVAGLCRVYRGRRVSVIEALYEQLPSPPNEPSGCPPRAEPQRKLPL